MAALSSLNARGMLAAVIYAIWTVFLLSLLRVYHTSRVHRAGRESDASWRGRHRIGHGGFSALLCSACRTFRAACWLYTFSQQRGAHRQAHHGSVAAARVRARGYNLKHMLVIGSGKLARRYVENVQADPTLGIHVEQCLAPAKGMLEQLESRLHDAGIDEVILALAPDELGVTVDVIQVCEKCGTKISVVPFYNDVIPTRPTIDMVGNLTEADSAAHHAAG